MFIDRNDLTRRIESTLDRSRVVALVGPRQCGKTTLAGQFVSIDSINYFDLEDPLSLARLDQPMTALRDLQGLVVIDEVQRRPDLFPVLRVLADRPSLPARFLILGSASPELLRQSSESLAGRISVITMDGFSLNEVGIDARRQLWLRGDSPCLSSHQMRKAALNGGKILCERFSNGIFHSLVSVFHRPACSDFGACWRIIMGKSGMRPKLLAR